MAAVRLLCAAAMRGRRPLEGPIEIEVSAVYPWPKSISGRAREGKGAIYKTSRADIDNAALKLPLDALNGQAWRDDAQVAQATIRKIYGNEPGLTINIQELS